jgi:mannose/fructose/N-acetylgalactosamine-specific phosphotransferase system component IIB
MIVLFRVDGRLIHGQVTTGWAHSLCPDALVVIDDEVAECDWERKLYSAGVPCEMDGRFLTVEQALMGWQEIAEGPERVVVLVKELETVRKLVDGGITLDCVNLGGLHPTEKTRRVCPFIHVDGEDVDILHQLKKCGIDLDGRDVPGAAPENLTTILESDSDSEEL